MFRNEKGQFTKEKEIDYKSQIEATEAKLAQLKKAQAEKIEADKRAAALARKEDATPVIQAIDKYEEAKVVCNAKIKTAYEAYRNAINEAEKELKTYEADAEEKLDTFLKTHPEGFHYTFRNKDGSVVRDYDYRKHSYDVFDNYDDFMKALKNLWYIK